jgi:PAS domain S-box-containing protein
VPKRLLEQNLIEWAQAMAHLGIWRLDPTTGEVTWTDEVYRLHDLEPGTPLTLDMVLDRVHPDDRAAATQAIDRMLDGAPVSRWTHRLALGDGSVRWIEVCGSRYRDGSLVGFVQDGTEQWESRQQLDLQAQILGALTESVVLARPADRQIVWSNRQAAAELGLTVDQLVGRNAAEFTAPGQDQLLAEGWAQLERTGTWMAEITRLRADGTSVDTEASYTTMDHPLHGRVLVTVSHVIDDRKARERALLESEMHLRAVQDNAPTGVATIDLTGRWLYVNDAVCTLLGRSRTELARTTMAEAMHPDEMETALSQAQELQDGRARTQSERRYLRADGSVVWVLITATLVRNPEGEPNFYVLHLVDVTDRKTEEDRRRRQAEEVERANRAKTEFLSRMSHELRTPLNAVLGFGQLLADADLPDEDERAVEQILYAGRHLLGLINEVLDITRVESGTLDLRLEPVMVADVIGEAVQLVRPEAARMGVTMTVADDDGQARLVRSDRRRVVQVLLNLLSNAIKYNRPGGVVVISSGPGPSGVRIAVADSGRGIAASSLPRLFEPFDRLGIEQEGIEGTGIGLALAQGLVHEMGGTITVESEAGVGSTFTVELPAADVVPAAPGVDLGDQRSPAATGGDDRPPVTIVNIEDNPANQQLIESILRKRSGVELWTAPDAGTGLELVRRHRPDLVILDLHLPDLSGAEVLRRLRAEPSGPPPVVAVCSADANPAQIQHLLRLGADHYLTKPFDIPTLLAIVDGAARRQPSTPADVV